MAKQPKPQVSEYYKQTSKIPLASNISLHVRRRMFDLFMATMRPDEHTSVLDLGVTCDERQKDANYFEQFYPHLQRVVCAGTEDARHLEQSYPGVSFKQVFPNQPLPFEDQQFDIVFSNAVVEHTGSTRSQMYFIGEALRVSKHFFLTTPNRWFPIEMHTGLPLLHYLPIPMHRALMTKIGLPFWAAEANLHLLDPDSFRRLFPQSAHVQITTIKTLGWPSNVIAHGASRT